MAICQDRALEKALFVRCGVPCAPHAVIDGESALAAVSDALLPGILKTAQLGYDGKGQRSVDDRDQLAGAWRQLGAVRCVLERRLELAFEISVVLARGVGAGALVSYPPFRNLHRDGILAVTHWPAPQLDGALASAADAAARTIAHALDYVGVLCVEFFVDSQRRARTPTRWRRGRTTRATARSMPAMSASSIGRCARWRACRCPRRACIRVP